MEGAVGLLIGGLRPRAGLTLALLALVATDTLDGVLAAQEADEGGQAGMTADEPAIHCGDE